jgi:hypothetical protein
VAQAQREFTESVDLSELAWSGRPNKKWWTLVSGRGGNGGKGDLMYMELEVHENPESYYNVLCVGRRLIDHRSSPKRAHVIAPWGRTCCSMRCCVRGGFGNKKAERQTKVDS